MSLLLLLWKSCSDLFTFKFIEIQLKYNTKHKGKNKSKSEVWSKWRHWLTKVRDLNAYPTMTAGFTGVLNKRKSEVKTKPSAFEGKRVVCQWSPANLYYKKTPCHRSWVVAKIAEFLASDLRSLAFIRKPVELRRSKRLSLVFWTTPRQQN